jgi:hypothetical protein
MPAIDPADLPVTSEIAASLLAHVRYLAGPDLAGRKPGQPGNRAAAQYIGAKFRDMGLSFLPSLGGYAQPLSGGLGDNLIAVITAPPSSALSSSPYLLLAAHYDHLGGRYLGADDNASAVAILLETARTLPQLSHHHVLFVAFNAEEPPYIRTAQMGSQYFVDHLPDEIGGAERFQAAIVMDLMGGVHWEPLRETVFAAGAEKSRELYRRVRKSASPAPENPCRSGGRECSPQLTVLPLGLHLIEELPLLGRTPVSDYDAFRRASVPFVFLSSGRTPRYHEPTDLPETLHYERMADTVLWLQQRLVAMDQDREPYSFEADRLEFADEAATLRSLISLAADEKSRIPGTSGLSLRKLKQDAAWLKGLDSQAPAPEDIKRLERVSLRMQCLLADIRLCFLF